MAKDSFFIRAQVTAPNDGTFGQTDISLGSYVDALGKSVLRLHNLQVTYQDSATAYRPPLYSSGSGAEVIWQLTTQSQTEIVYASDRSLISGGMSQFAAVGSGTADGQLSSESAGINPQHWTNGFLIGVEEIFLGGQSTGTVNPTVVSVVLECTVETLTQNAAMALALSQQ